jgi:hypothetical protein
LGEIPTFLVSLCNICSHVLAGALCASSSSAAEVDTSQKRVKKGRKEGSENFTKNEVEEMFKVLDAIKQAGKNRGKQLLVNFSPRVELSGIGP